MNIRWQVLAGANSVNELLKLKSEIVGLLNLGKFELYKMRSNVPIETQDLIAPTVPLRIDAKNPGGVMTRWSRPFPFFLRDIINKNLQVQRIVRVVTSF